MPLPLIDPPLINSSNPWATTAEDLQALFDSEHTGAVTTRTSLIHGFEHDDKIHQRVFFNPKDSSSTARDLGRADVSSDYGGSLNTLGYSPLTLNTYLAMILKVLTDSSLPDARRSSKSFIISVTGSAEAVGKCYERIQDFQQKVRNPLLMEINLSCPNIPDKPPPAYSASSLAEYLELLGRISGRPEGRRVAIGIKTPPYTYYDGFKTLVEALRASSKPKCPVEFITATNTLGSCLLLSDAQGTPILNSASGAGIGGMAGDPLHPLALGNVKTIRDLLDKYDELRDIDIIGIGGVKDKGGFERMRAVGAKVVGVGTALGREGVEIFGKILRG